MSSYAQHKVFLSLLYLQLNTIVYATSVIKSKCDNLRHTLEEATEYNIHTIESYDFKLVNKTPSAAYNREGARIDVRLKVMDDGKLSILAMQMNERKLAYFDTFCLQRYICKQTPKLFFLQGQHYVC